MQPNISPPPNEDFEESDSIDEQGDFGRWYGWNVVNGKLALPVVEVNESTIPPNCENVNAHLAINESYDEPVDGIEIVFEVPDIIRWNDMSENEYERLQEDNPGYTVSDCTTEEVWLFSDPRDVSHGWDSPWHGLAGIKRNMLPSKCSIHDLVGCHLLFAGYINDDDVEWVIDINSPLSQAVTATNQNTPY